MRYVAIPAFSFVWGLTDVEQEQLPLLLARTFGQAAMNIVSPLRENIFSPLSIIGYADGQQMLSMTGALVKRDHELAMRSAMNLENWPSKPSDWESMGVHEQTLTP